MIITGQKTKICQLRTRLIDKYSKDDNYVKFLHFTLRNWLVIIYYVVYIAVVYNLGIVRAGVMKADIWSKFVQNDR